MAQCRLCAPLPQGPEFSATSNLSRGTWLTPSAPCLHTPLGIRARTQGTTLEVGPQSFTLPIPPNKALARMAESRAFITNTPSRDNLDSGCSWRKQPPPQSTTVVTTVSWIAFSLVLSTCPHAQGLQPSQTPAPPGRFKPTVQDMQSSYYSTSLLKDIHWAHGTCQHTETPQFIA